MTQTYSLKLKMGTLSGSKTFTFKYANPDVTSQQVQVLAQALIANGSVYKYPPQVLETATLEEVAKTTIFAS